MKQMKSASIPFWMPQPDAASKERSAEAADSGSAAPAERGRWPELVDMQYFQSELRMAFEYLDIAHTCPEYGNECVTRALRMYVLLSGWVQANGGNPEFQEHLQRLRWRIAALREPEAI